MSDTIYEQMAQTVIQRVDLAPLVGREVLLTGASGLLGIHLTNVLAQSGAYVHLQTNSRRMVTTRQNVRVWYANLANPNDCERLPRADYVISAASWAQPLRFLSEPLMALRSASFGLLALLEKVNPGGRFMYVSSSEVYCDCKAEPPFTEEQFGAISPYHPRACYIMGKLHGEAMTYLYRNRGISTVAVRPGITYGPGFQPNDRRSWAQFVMRAVRDGEIRLMDAGLVKRTFCYMTDGMQLMLSILLYGTQRVYNMSGRDRVSIADLARTIGELAGVPVLIPDEGEGVAGTPDDLQLDSSLAENEFGKTDYVSLHDGMAQTFRWAKETHAP